MKAQIPLHLSDADLVAEVTRLAGRERGATADLVAHLAELDRRGLHLAAGFPSLFAYCTEVLRLSEDAACNRITTARMARRYPHILGLLTDGSLNVTTVRLLGRHLTDENQGELIAAASGKSKRQVEELLARWFPQPDAPVSIRRLAAAAAQVAAAPAAAVRTATTPIPGSLTATEPPALVPLAPTPSTWDATPRVTAPPLSAAPLPVPAHSRPAVTPLSAARYKVTFTAGAETCEKLRRAQALMRHAVPDGDVAAIFDRALTLLLADVERRKFAATPQPRGSHDVGSTSRHIPAAVKRVVSERDGGQCNFVGKDGRRCGSRAFLEFHHVRPFAEGGEATVQNIKLLCGTHNRHEADVFYRAAIRSGTDAGGRRIDGA
jgi:hypothetical protein